MDLLLFFYSLLFLVSSSYLSLKFRNKGWTIENLFLLIIIIFYLFIPINIIVFGSYIYESSLNTYMVPVSKYVSFSSLLITLMFILVFILAGALRGNLLKPVKIYIRTFNKINSYKIASYFLAFISLISLLLYIHEYGGLSSFVSNLSANRSGLLDESLIGQYAFFGRFINLAIIPVTYFLYEKRRTKIDLIFLLFIPLSVCVFNNLFIDVSKLKFVILVMLFYFTESIKKNKLYFQYLFLIFAVTFIALPILDEVFVIAYKIYKNEGISAVPLKVVSAIFSGSLGQGHYETFLKDNSNSYFKSLEYLTYIQMSLQFSIDHNYPLLFFRDFLTGMNQLLPSRLNIQTGLEAHQLNTYIYMFSSYSPNLPALTWAIPPGPIGFGMYSLSVPGVALIAFLLGYVFREVDLFFKSIIEIDKRFSPFYAYTLFVLGIYTINGSPKDVMYDFVFLVFLFIFLCVSFKFEVLNRKKS